VQSILSSADISLVSKGDCEERLDELGDSSCGILGEELVIDGVEQTVEVGVVYLFALSGNMSGKSEWIDGSWILSLGYEQ
jgi:hypothetical protein